MRNLMFSIALPMVLWGCQSAADGREAGAGVAPLSEAANHAIAGDMVSRFSEHAGQGSGTIVLREGATSFGEALSAALKGSGYTVAIDQKAGTGKPIILLAYAVENFEGQVLARLSTKDIALTRVYGTTLSGAMPKSPLTVIRHN